MQRDVDALGELAALHGIQPSYTDNDGVCVHADPTVVFALLQALGVPIERPGDALALLRNRRAAALRQQLEPVLIHRLGRPGPLAAIVPSAAELQSIWLSLELEDGTTRRSDLASVLTRRTKSVEPAGAAFSRVFFELDALVDAPLPPGYHRLTLEGAGAPASSLVVSAPDCPDGPREWGAFLPLHSLRTARDSGVGTYSDLARLGDWVTSVGGGFVGTLPLYPAFLDPPADPSPYLPVSRLAYNELFIDPTVLPEFRAAQARPDDAGPMAAQISARMVDYEAVARRRRAQLEPMARAVVSGEFSQRRQQLCGFAAHHPELAAYARFRASLESSPRLGDPDPGLVGYHLYCQWVASAQLEAAGRAAGRYADFPVGSHPAGFDPAWSPQSFVPGVEGGSPPDRFFAGGQSWGFRPLHPERMREDGYRFFCAALRRAFQHADCLRIDHVMGLQRLYMIPQGHHATDGAYVSYRAEELHALVALEASRAGAVVVGEDLGTVPPEVRRRMTADHMLRTWVFQFESTPEKPLPQPAPNTLASLGTHDLPRFGAYLWGEDIDERASAGTLEPEQVKAERTLRTRWRSRLFDALAVPPDMEPALATTRALHGCLQHLGRSDAAIVLVDLEELWDERHPQNNPGTTSNENWRRRAARSLEDFSSDQAILQPLSELSAERPS